jgi:hypothetical protein
VHAWSTIFTYRMEKSRRGRGDVEWLERCFHKLPLNFTWWVNRKDRAGKNVFEGGFLGLDNIGLFDRSAPLPTGGYLEQADGTAWMALFCQNMLEIAGQLALEKPAYTDMCLKFLEHYLWIASSMVHAGEDVGMWEPAPLLRILSWRQRRWPRRVAPDGLDGPDRASDASVRVHLRERGARERENGTGARTRARRSTGVIVTMVTQNELLMDAPSSRVHQ